MKHKQISQEAFERSQNEVKEKKYFIHEQLCIYKERIIAAIAPYQVVSPFEKTENQDILKEIYEQLNDYAKYVIASQKELLQKEKKEFNLTAGLTREVREAKKEILMQLDSKIKILLNTLSDLKLSIKNEFKNLNAISKGHDKLITEYSKQLKQTATRHPRDAVSAAALTDQRSLQHLFRYVNLDPNQQLINATIGRQL